MQAQVADERGTWTLTINGKSEQFQGSSFSRWLPLELVEKLRQIDSIIDGDGYAKQLKDCGNGRFVLADVR